MILTPYVLPFLQSVKKYQKVLSKGVKRMFIELLFLESSGTEFIHCDDGVFSPFVLSALGGTWKHKDAQ